MISTSFLALLMWQGDANKTIGNCGASEHQETTVPSKQEVSSSVKRKGKAKVKWTHVVSPLSSSEDVEMKELKTAFAASRLPLPNSQAGPSQLLSPIHLEEASLPLAEDKSVVAPRLSAMEVDEGEQLAMAMVEDGVEGDEDATGNEDLKAQKGAAEGEGEEVDNVKEAVAETMARVEEEEEMLKEEPNWQWLPPYGPTASWLREVSNTEDVTRLEPQQPVVTKINPS